MAQAVDQEAGGEVVAAVQHQIGGAYQFRHVVLVGAAGNGLDMAGGIYPLQTARGRLHLGQADAVGLVHDLALQIAQVDPVVVHQGEPPQAGGRQVERDRRTQAADADDQCMAVAQALLPLEAEFGQHDLAAVTEQGVVVHVRILNAAIAAWCHSGQESYIALLDRFASELAPAEKGGAVGPDDLVGAALAAIGWFSSCWRRCAAQRNLRKGGVRDNAASVVAGRPGSRDRAFDSG